MLIEDLDLGSKSMLNLVKKSIGFQKTKDFNILEPNKKVIVRNVYDNGVVEVHHNTSIYTNVYANQLVKERA